MIDSILKGFFASALIGLIFAIWRYVQNLAYDKMMVIKERTDVELQKNEETISNLDVDSLIAEDNERLRASRAGKKDSKE